MKVTFIPTRAKDIVKLHFEEAWLVDEEDKAFGTFAVSMNKHMRNKLVYVFFGGDVDKNKKFLKYYFGDCLNDIKVFDDGRSLIIPFDYIHNVKTSED